MAKAKKQVEESVDAVATKPEIKAVADPIKHKVVEAIRKEVASKLKQTFKISASEELIDKVAKDLGFLAFAKGPGGPSPTEAGADYASQAKAFGEWSELIEQWKVAPAAPPKALTPEDKAKRKLKSLLKTVDAETLKAMVAGL
jgi:hypothetical protein